jgi:EAL domain-containing protein (putative c-di-GMP-specific phosphodiesterase class I)
VVAEGAMGRRGLDPEQLVRRASRGLLELLDHAGSASVGLPRPDGTVYLFRTIRDREGDFDIVVDVRQSLCGWAMATGRSAICEDARSDPNVDRAIMAANGLRSSLYVPLMHAGKVVGVLAAGSPSPKAFNETDLRRAEAVASVVATVVATSEALTKLVSDFSTPGHRAGLRVDAAEIEAVGAFVTSLVDPGLAELGRRRLAIEAVLAEGGPTMVVQPIFELRGRSVVGVEALARFPTRPVRPPDRWFTEAERVGLGADLELAAARRALALLAELPPAVALAVNVGPVTLRDERFAELVGRVEAERVVVELTEHLRVDDYAGLGEAVARLRRYGARLSVDDAGAGYASFSHVLELRPDMVKLDRSLVRRIDRDGLRRDLAASLVGFAHRAGALVVAEGLETAGELATVEALGVEYGQGYYLARPGSLGESPTACSDPSPARRRV